MPALDRVDAEEAKPRRADLERVAIRDFCSAADALFAGRSDLGAQCERGKGQQRERACIRMVGVTIRRKRAGRKPREARYNMAARREVRAVGAATASAVPSQRG